MICSGFSLALFEPMASPSLKRTKRVTALDENAQALKAEFESLMRLLEDLRARPLVIPEKHFQAGRKKVKDGRYDPDSEILQNGI